MLLVLTAAALRAEGLSRKERDDLAGRGAELFAASQPAAARELWEKMLAGGATGAEQRRWRPWVGRAFALKRFHARGRGKSSRVEKSYANITVVVAEREETA